MSLCGNSMFCASRLWGSTFFLPCKSWHLMRNTRNWTWATSLPHQSSNHELQEVRQKVDRKFWVSGFWPYLASDQYIYPEVTNLNTQMRKSWSSASCSFICMKIKHLQNLLLNASEQFSDPNWNFIFPYFVLQKVNLSIQKFGNNQKCLNFKKPILAAISNWSFPSKVSNTRHGKIIFC